MTSSRIQPPTINLKERIAALQQLGLPDSRSISPTAATPSPTSAGLRDKIAKFEKRGRVPAPRGSFGLGAPPLAENGPQKRRGELYGNRIPPGVRASFGGSSLSRAGSPLDSARSFSMPRLDGEESEIPESPPYLSSPFSSPSSSPKSPTAAAGALRQSATILHNEDEADHEIVATPSPIFTSPDFQTSQCEVEDEEVGVQVHALPPSIVISPDGSLPPAEVPSIHGGDVPVETPNTDTWNPIPSSSPPPADPATPAPAVEVETKGTPNHVELPELSGLPPEPSSVSPNPPPSASAEESVVKSIPNTSKVPQLLSEDGPHLVSADLVPLSLADTNTSTRDTTDTIRQDDVLCSPSLKAPILDPVSLPSNHDESATSPAAESLAIEDAASLSTVVHQNEKAMAFAAKFTSHAEESVVIPEVKTIVVQQNDEAVAPAAKSTSHAEESVVIPKVKAIVVPQDDEAVATADKSARHIEETVVIPEVSIPEVKAREDLSSEESPIGPNTLANVVASLGQMVADIHDLFPDQLSPLTSPPTYQPMSLKPTPDDKSSRERKKSTLTTEKRKSVELTIRLDSEPDDAAKEILPDTTVGTQAIVSSPDAPVTDDMLKVTSHSAESAPLTASPSSGFLNTPHSARSRHMSMIETSPGQVAFGQRVTPFTGRTMYIPPHGQHDQRDFHHFPPTPGPREPETQYGTVSMGHAPTHSRAPSFSAVVHRKVTELPSSTSMPSMLNPPVTPGKRGSFVVREGLMSPGQGELASLLQSAALLEETLGKGDLPDEVTAREMAEQREREAQERADAEARAIAEEEGRKNQAALKNRVKDQPQKRTKRTFRMLKDKSPHRRDPSVSSSDGQPISSKDLATRLPFRPQSYRQSTEGPSRPSDASSRQTLHAPSLEVHAEPPSRDADAGSQTSPRSPLQYLANLRRFASAGRTSTGSSTHPRHSASTSSEMSSDDSVPLATPPDSADSASSLRSSHHGSGIPWPSLSPKKSGGSVGRAAAFAEKMWSRGRSKSSNSASASAYDTIDRLTRSAAAKAAVASIPPLDPIAFSLEVPSPENTLPSPQPDLVSPRRSKSFQASSTSRFPPVYTPIPTSPVYTSHLPPSALRSALRPEDAMQPLHVDSFYLAGKELIRPMSLVSEGVSEGSSTSSILSPLFDSFPSVPTSISPPLESPRFPQEYGHTNLEINIRPPLPSAVPSFFDAAPLSSAVVGAEFLPSPNPFPRSPAVSHSAMLPPMSFER